jgi:hypothetical protein
MSRLTFLIPLMLGPMRPFALHLNAMRASCTLISVVLAVLLSACNSKSGANANGRVMVVGTNGVPIQGAILVPEEENPPTATQRYSDAELRERASNAKGIISVELDDCLWDSDGCYHFRIRRNGFEDVAMTVSKELFPPVLRIELKVKSPTPN